MRASFARDNRTHSAQYPNTAEKMEKSSKSSNSSSLHPIEASHLHARRERTFLILAALFLGSLTMLNILGVSRFMVLFTLVLPEDGTWSIDWWKWGVPNRDIAFALAVGVLPYPITFLCTDLISEFYGRKRANWVVFAGLLLNLWVMFIFWLAGVMPETPKMDPDTGLPKVSIAAKSLETLEEEEQFTLNIEDPTTEGPSAAEKRLEEVRTDFKVDIPKDYAFYKMRSLAFAAVFASMIAYLAAQFVDVWLYHFWKRLTKGKHLWLRNNGSTLISQLVDTVAVILITHFLANGLPIEEGLTGNALWQVLFLTFILPGYVFKLIVALLDTIPLYILVGWLKKHLEFEPATAD